MNKIIKAVQDEEYNSRGGGSGGTGLSPYMLDRLSLFNSTKEAKMDMIKKQLESEEIESCTFHPTVKVSVCVL